MAASALMLMDLFKEPARVQAAVGQHHHRPVGGHAALSVAQEGFPMGAPGAGTCGFDDAPGHGDGTAADHHTDREAGEALPACRGVQGEGEVVAGGAVQATTQPSRGAKQRVTSRLRRLRPRLAPLLSLASRYQSRSCSRIVIAEQPNT